MATTPAAARMSRHDLEQEVIRLRADPRGHLRDLERANERVLRLERRITDQGVLLLKQASQLKQARRTHDELRSQLEAANANAARFHALMLQARVSRIVAREATDA